MVLNPSTSRHDATSLYRTALVAAIGVVSAAVLVACQPAVAPAQASSTQAAAPQVPVVTVQESQDALPVTQVARVEAAQRVELRPQVAGRIDAVLFREGDLVRAGQPLFRLDQRPFDAAVARAEADVRLARTRESLTATEAKRAIQLAAESAIATEEMERRKAAHGEAQARLAAAEAALQSATLDRDFALVRAPIDGRIGRALVTAGNVVAAGSSQTPLATLVGVAPLHVHFDVSDRQLAASTPKARSTWRVRILDAEGGRELGAAPVDFVDNEIAAATGTVRLRARVDSPAAGLLPGQFVRVEMSTGGARGVLKVPDAAVGTDQGRRYVLVVKPDRTVEYRAVELGPLRDGQRIVTSGLVAGEQVIVSGLLRVRPGMTVDPQSATQQPQATGPQPGRV